MKKVIVYSTPTCVYCRMAKDWLEEKGIVFESVDLSLDMAKAEEIIEKTGQQGVPVIEIGGEFVLGFDRERMAELLGVEE